MDDLPFRGQTFLVATSEDLADKVARAVREKGGRAIPFPTIRLVPPADYENLDRGLRLWRTLDWVVFTSAHGVEAVVDRSRALGVDLAGFQGKVAAVGPATKAAAEAAGLAVSLVPNEFLTDAIAGALGNVCGRTIFLPRSRIARKSLADELRDRGAQVIEADAYDAIPTAPDIDVLRETDRIDVVLLTSASAATHLMDLLPKDVRDRLIHEAEAACIVGRAWEGAGARGGPVAVFGLRRRDPLRPPGGEGFARPGSVRRKRRRAGSRPRGEAGRTGSHRDSGCLPLRIHRPWALRRGPGRSNRQRRVPRTARQDGREPGTRGRRPRGSKRDDGRPGRRHPRGLGPRRIRGDGDPRVRSEARLRVLWPVPRRRRFRPPGRRPPPP